MKNIFLTLFAVFSFLKIDVVLADNSESSQPTRSLKYGIREKVPYCFKQENGKYNGLDLQIFDLLSLEDGLSPADFNSAPLSWAENLTALKNGTIDVIGNATETQDRKAWGIFSVKYRDEEHVIVTPQNQSVSFTNADTFIDYVTKNEVKVGIVEGVSYNSAKIRNYLVKTPPKKDYVFSNYDDLFNALMQGTVDLAIMDSIHVQYLLNKQNKSREYTITHIGAIAPQHFLFSKKTIRPELVAMFNKAIANSSARIRAIVDEYTAKLPEANLLFPEGARHQDGSKTSKVLMPNDDDTSGQKAKLDQQTTTDENEESD